MSRRKSSSTSYCRIPFEFTTSAIALVSLKILKKKNRALFTTPQTTSYTQNPSYHLQRIDTTSTHTRPAPEKKKLGQQSAPKPCHTPTKKNENSKSLSLSLSLSRFPRYTATAIGDNLSESPWWPNSAAQWALTVVRLFSLSLSLFLSSTAYKKKEKARNEYI